MAEEVGRLEVVLDARLSQFEAKVAKAEARINRAAGKMKGSAQTVETAWQKSLGVLGRLAPAVLGGTLVAAADRAITKLDAIGKTADRLGVTTDALQELRFAAEQAGVGANTLDMALQRFGRRAAEARQGSGEAKDALAELGVALTDSAGNARRVEDMLDDVADALSKMENQTDRNRIAMRLFDTEGVALVNMLRDGSDGLDRMADRARDFGAVMEEDAIRGAEALRSEIDAFLTWVEGAWLGVFGRMTMALNDLLNLDGAETLAERVNELRAVQDTIARMSAGGGGGLGDAEVLAEARRREGELLAEIRRLNDAVNGGSGAIVTDPVIVSGGGGGRTSSARTDADRRAQAEEAVLERLAEQIVRYAALQDQVGKTGDALADLVAEQEAFGIVGDHVTAQTVEMAEALIKARRGYEEMAEAQQKSEEAAQAQTRAYGDMARSLAEAVTSGEDLEKVLVRLAAQLVGAELSALITGTGTSLLAPLFGRATGGGTAPGRPYLVGEKGPEIFMPRVPGAVLNATQTRGAMGGVGVTYAPVINVQGGGGDVRREVEAALAQDRATFEPRVVQAVRRAQAGRML